jgi:hypothetical protein
MSFCSISFICRIILKFFQITAGVIMINYAFGSIITFGIIGFVILFDAFFTR